VVDEINEYLSLFLMLAQRLTIKNLRRTLLLLTILFCASQYTLAQNISTFAGNGVSGFNGDNISAAAASLNGPQGLALDAARNLYIADLVNCRIRKVNQLTGVITTICGDGTPAFGGDGGLATAAKISNPSALNFDANGDLFFTDRGNCRIRKIDMTTGIITTVAGNGTCGFTADGVPATSSGLNNPNEVSFDAAGDMYIADWINNRIRKVDKLTGLISTVAGTGTAAYNGDGILATAANINGPCGIIFDNADNLFFAEYGGHRVRKITKATGIISTVAGNGSFGYNGDNILAKNAQLASCAYIKFDDAQNLYIGDAGNHRIRRINAADSIITTVAGTGVPGTSGDGGPATSAMINVPYALYFDRPKCNMYISDYTDARIRLVTGGFAGCTPMPISLLFFKAKDESSFIDLQWEKVNGNSTDKFNIERSSDGEYFFYLGMVNRTNSHNAPYDYIFRDNSPLKGTNYYRLKETGPDGRISYSPIIAVRTKIKIEESFAMFPNPAHQQASVNSKELILHLQVFNIDGKLVSDYFPDANTITFPVNKQGTYIVRCTTIGKISSAKLVVY
jgi:sugar lactone lactonase YvrE